MVRWYGYEYVLGNMQKGNSETRRHARMRSVNSL